MSKNQYYEDLKESQILKIKELKSQLPAYTHDFIDDKRRTRQPSTALAYTYDLMTFFRYLKEMNPSLKNTEIRDIPLELIQQLDFRDINEYQDYLELNKGTNYHKNETRAINRRLSALRGFYRYGCSHGILEKDATAGTSQRIDKKKDATTARLDVNEVLAVMDKVRNSDLQNPRAQAHAKHYKLRDTAILTLFLGTGIRVSELVSLNMGDFNFENQSFRVTRKGGKEMTLYFNEEVRDALQDYIQAERPEVPEEEDALFLSNRKKRMCVKSVENIVKKYSEDISDKTIRPHRLRKTYGTALYQAVGDIKLVADTLGHKDISTTNRSYTDQSDANRRIAGNMKLYSEKEE